ncbi:unnamed protein product [Angiostrongylus costaricensis]|uniref:Str_synth domain-containing protein n=1 Tax=Angiostrongylus costaricensis TaxID=334426 RepID=A0A158PFF3_ANGCS|nr:unnamed protein product [Angiostrongylus costaricensis]
MEVLLKLTPVHQLTRRDTNFPTLDLIYQSLSTDDIRQFQRDLDDEKNVGQQQFRVGSLKEGLLDYCPSENRRHNTVVCSPILFVSVVAASLAIAISSTYLLASAPIDALEYQLPRPTLFEDKSVANEQLTNGERLLEDQIYGPESIAVNKNTGLVYTGLRTGLICEIDLSGEPKIIRAVRLTSHENCDGSYHSMPRCGRPLGMSTKAVRNILIRNLEEVRQLFAGATPASDDDSTPPTRYLNDFDFLPDGRLIISESSTKFDDRDFIYDLLEHRPNGRILEYNLVQDKLSVLVTNLYFPNGVQAVQGKVLIAEMGNARILKQVNLTTYSPSSGNVDVLVDNLPGYPDNIRVSGDGALWVPLAATRTENDNWLAVRPRLRTLLTMEFQIDLESGKLLESFHDRTGHISEVSVAVEDGRGNLLIGSDVQCYIGRIKL